MDRLVVARGLVVPAAGVLVGLQELLALPLLAVMAALAALTAAAAVQLDFIMRLAVQVALVRFVSSGPAQLVASPQQIQETCNA